VTFALNRGRATSREECARLIICQTLHDFPKAPIFHPMLVGDAFFERLGMFMNA